MHALTKFCLCTQLQAHWLLLLKILTLFLSDRGFSFLSAGVLTLSPVAATELAVEPAAALAEAVAPAFPSTLDDCTHTHKQEHKAHMQEGKRREERR